MVDRPAAHPREAGGRRPPRPARQGIPGGRAGPRTGRPRHAAAPQALAYPLQPEVLHLSGHIQHGDPPQPGLVPERVCRSRLDVRQHVQTGRDLARGLLHQPFRDSAVQHVLQALHRESVGTAAFQTGRELGQATGKRHIHQHAAQELHPPKGTSPQRHQAGRCREITHLELPLPQTGTRTTVGGGCAGNHPERRGNHPGTPGMPPQPARRESP